MRRINLKQYLIFIGIAVFAVACNAKKILESEKGAPTEKNLEAIRTKFPDTNMEELEKGHSIFFGACQRCHHAKIMSKRSVKEWTRILKRMAPRAKLNTDERNAVYKFVLSVRLQKKPN